jgi:hypothetical protein
MSIKKILKFLQLFCLLDQSSKLTVKIVPFDISQNKRSKHHNSSCHFAPKSLWSHEKQLYNQFFIPIKITAVKAILTAKGAGCFKFSQVQFLSFFLSFFLLGPPL